MKRLHSSAAVAAIVGLLGCCGRLDGGDSAPDVLVACHFAGVAQLSAQADGTKLKEILDLPQTAVLGRHVLDRLSRVPGLLIPWLPKIESKQEVQGAKLFRPLLEDLVRRESFLDVRGPSGEQAEWLLGIALPAERKALWQTNLAELAALWKLGPTEVTQKNGSTVTTLDRSQSPTTVRWVDAGGWFLLGASNKSPGAWDKALVELGRTGRPCLPLTGSWLTVQLDLARLAPSFDLPSSVIWPRADLEFTGREESVRTTMQLTFPEQVTGPLEPWQVPTNAIREPLISFTAWRGARPLLSRWEILKRLGFDPAPNEVYFWAQALNLPQTLCAFPVDDASQRMHQVARVAPELIPQDWRDRGLAQTEWSEEEQQLVWKSLPLLLPHLRAATDTGRDFIVGGLFPAFHTTNPPPSELLDQFVRKPDVLYYNWEITSQRLNQLRLQVQLSTLLTRRPVLATNSPALPWLDELQGRLGNAATEVTARAPNQWSMVRKSHVGLTAAELMGFVAWIESPDFPRLTLRFPESPKPKPKAAPKRVR